MKIPARNFQLGLICLLLAGLACGIRQPHPDNSATLVTTPTTEVTAPPNNSVSAPAPNTSDQQTADQLEKLLDQLDKANSDAGTPEPIK